MNPRLGAVTFRRARMADACALATVHIRSWQAAYRELLPADFLAGLSIPDWTERWHSRLHSHPLGTTIAELAVFQANQRAQAFYRNAGFEPDGASKPITIETTTLTEIRFRRLAKD